MGGRRTGNLGRNWCGLGGFRVTRRHLSPVSGCAFGWGAAIPAELGHLAQVWILGRGVGGFLGVALVKLGHSR